MNLLANNQMDSQDNISAIQSATKEESCIICKNEEGTITYRHKKICRNCLREIQRF